MTIASGADSIRPRNLSFAVHPDDGVGSRLDQVVEPALGAPGLDDRRPDPCRAATASTADGRGRLRWTPLARRLGPWTSPHASPAPLQPRPTPGAHLPMI